MQTVELWLPLGESGKERKYNYNINIRITNSMNFRILE